MFTEPKNMSVTCLLDLTNIGQTCLSNPLKLGSDMLIIITTTITIIVNIINIIINKLKKNYCYWKKNYKFDLKGKKKIIRSLKKIKGKKIKK